MFFCSEPTFHTIEYGEGCKYKPQNPRENSDLAHLNYIIPMRLQPPDKRENKHKAMISFDLTHI